MTAIRYHKLVRDRIPEIIEASGKACSWRVMSSEEYRESLLKKLGEELSEYLESHQPEELADLLEVMMACAQAQGVSWDEVEQIRMEKAQKRGAFRQRICLEDVSG